MNKLLAITVVAAALSGCSTPYKGVGIAGGHHSIAGPGKLERVSFYGNGFTSGEKAQKFALYRCAELAKSRGKPYFLIYESLSDAVRDKHAELPLVGMLGNFPSATAFILLLEEPRLGSKETSRVLSELEPLVKSSAQAAAKG